MTMLCWKPGWGTAWKQQHLCPKRQEERTGLWKDIGDLLHDELSMGFLYVSGLGGGC